LLLLAASATEGKSPDSLATFAYLSPFAMFASSGLPRPAHIMLQQIFSPRRGRSFRQSRRALRVDGTQHIRWAGYLPLLFNNSPDLPTTLRVWVYSPT